MADGDGMDRLNQRMTRGRRAVPPPRRPTPPAPPPTPSPEPVATSDAAVPADTALVECPARSPAPAGAKEDAPTPAGHDTPQPSFPPTTLGALDQRPPALPGSSPRDTGRSAGNSLLLEPGEPQANLAVRVRRSLDLRLDDLLHDLRHKSLRSSKAELVEMLLWELPSMATIDLEDRLDRFRHAGGRR